MSNIQLMIAYFNAWNERDAEQLVATFSPQGRYEDPIWRGQVRSPEFRAYLEEFWSAFPDMFMDVASLDQIESGSAVGQWTMCATNRGPLFGGRATDRAIELRGADLFTFAGGFIDSVVSRFDGFEFVRQMGYDIVLRKGQDVELPLQGAPGGLLH